MQTRARIRIHRGPNAAAARRSAAKGAVEQRPWAVMSA